jgi:hypothetical protein
VIPIAIIGQVEPQFEAVRRCFLTITNFEQGREIGAAVAVYHRGKLVVDLAAGIEILASAEL